jgi:hypothetical protein
MHEFFRGGHWKIAQRALSHAAVYLQVTKLSALVSFRQDFRVLAGFLGSFRH